MATWQQQTPQPLIKGLLLDPSDLRLRYSPMSFGLSAWIGKEQTVREAIYLTFKNLLATNCLPYRHYSGTKLSDGNTMADFSISRDVFLEPNQLQVLSRTNHDVCTKATRRNPNQTRMLYEYVIFNIIPFPETRFCPDLPNIKGVFWSRQNTARA